MKTPTAFSPRHFVRAASSPLIGCLGVGALFLTLLSGPTTATAAPVEPFYLTGGTVISMVPGQQPYEATVLVKDGRIAAIAQHPSLSVQDRVVDISGRYLLPGFIDMHAHVTFLRHPSDNERDAGYDRRTSELVLRDLLAAGVTTVRNPAAPPVESGRLRDDVAAGRILGPRIFTAGWPLNGKPSTDEGIRAEVDRQCALKVDYIKVYANSTPRQTAAAIDEAHKCGVKVIGHLQATDWPTAADLGIDFITHGVSWSASTLPATRRAEYEAQIRTLGALRARIFWLESIDVKGPEMDAVIAALTRHHISVDPTLVAYETKFVPLEKYRSAENVTLAPPAIQESWRSDGPTTDWTADDFARMKQAWPKMLAIVSRYFRAGVLLTTGTDLPNSFVVPRVSLHQEMELLIQAGIPPAAVLAMSTRNAAIALGQAADIGTIEVGKRADLVVLDQNPLSNIRNTRRVDLVVVNGAMLRPAALRAKVVP
jgi:imidazolonepropionase-like amidohydrolase